MFVVLLIQHEMRMRRIFICVLPSLYKLFPNYLINGTILEKKLLNTKCIFWFSVQLLSETFLILRRTERDIIKSRGLPRRAEVAQGVPGRLRPRIFFTFRDYKGNRSSAKRTGRLYPRRNPWYSLSEAESTSGHMVLSDITINVYNSSCKVPIIPVRL